MKALKKLTLIAATSVTAFSLAITFYNSAALNNDSFMDAKFASNKRLDELNGDITIGRMAASTQSWDSLEVESVKIEDNKSSSSVKAISQSEQVALEPAIREDLELTLASVKLGTKSNGEANKLTELKEGSFSGSARTSNGYVEEVVVNLPDGRRIDIYSHKRMASNVFEYIDQESGEVRSAMMYESAKNTFTVMLTNDTYYPGTRLDFKTSGETLGNESNANWAMNEQNINSELAEGEAVQETYEQDQPNTEYVQDTNKDSPVVNYISGSLLDSDKYSNIESNGHLSDDKLLNDVDYYLKYALNTNHPQFNNQLNGGFVAPALFGEIISFITNTSMATYEIAPIGTILEKKLVNKLNDLIGFNEGEGIMTTGGSNANMLAIHCARNKFDRAIKYSGNSSHKFHIYVSDQAHYSFEKAVNIMGLGLSSIVKVNSVDGIMDSNALEGLISKSKKEGYSPLMIASTSGTTVLGSFDNIESNDLVAKKHKIWHHVDAAWGGPALFSPKLKDLMKGVQKADSVTWDAHKLMGTGLITSFILVKDKGQLIDANSGGGEKYLFHEYENSEFDTGPMSLQCGRKVDSLKIWLAWRYYGDDGYKALIEKQLDSAIYLEAIINEHPRLKLLYKRDFLNVCFQVIPEKNEDISEYNFKLRFKMMKEAKSLVNFARSKDQNIFFRYVLTNFATNKEDIDIFIKNLFNAEKSLNLS